MELQIQGVPKNVHLQEGNSDVNGHFLGHLVCTYSIEGRHHSKLKQTQLLKNRKYY